ncbi:MAG: hypothetical protein A4E54_02560 [Pelotomaculum sp. PtaB.Bin117]|nr:MAG: hypothetical protein A4E54_02560 [Pelotomaculum sp. PtaB.Bin117]
MFFIYEPKERKVYSIFPDKNNPNRLEMRLRVPAGFLVVGKVKEYLSKRLWDSFFNTEWPVVSAKGFSLFIQVGDQLIMIDMREKIIREAKI